MPQVVELVGDHEHAGARVGAPARTAPSSDSLDRTSTPAVGLISTSTRGSVDSARAITTFCWLPPDRPATGAAGPVVLMS